MIEVYISNEHFFTGSLLNVLSLFDISKSYTYIEYVYIYKKPNCAVIIFSDSTYVK